MKNITLCVLIAMPLFCLSQKNIDSLAFGNISPADLKMTECDFDKNAEAVVLFDVGEVKCIEYPYTVYTKINRHVRIKILKDKGLDEANITIPYYSYGKTESVSDLVAQTYNVDASGQLEVIKVDKKSFYDKKLNKKISQKIFTFPAVKRGSIIEYSYEVESSVEGGLKNWYFQRSIPVRLSRYTINFPDDIEVNSVPVCTLPVSREPLKRKDNHIYGYTFTMKNVPALRDEPFITCEDDYMQKVQSEIVALNTPLKRISLTRSWVSIIRNLLDDEDFGQQLSKNIPRTDSLDQMLKKIDSPYQKMATIFRYVRDRMEWNGMTSIWALDGVKSAWKDKKGTSGEINLILINLLKDAGINASPVLVSTHENGVVDQYRPSYSQFDNVMAYVRINERIYVLDATDKYASPNIIPLSVNFTEGLVIEKIESFQWGWRTLWNKNERFNSSIGLVAEINNDGVMKGLSNIRSTDYSRAERMRILKLGKDKFTEKYFAAGNTGIVVDSVEVENQNMDTLPLIQNVSFSQNLSSSGDYKYFKTNLFTSLEKNPFTADERFSDIFFGANQKFLIVANIKLPEDYIVDELPKNTRMIMPDTSIEFLRIMNVSENRLMMRTTLEFKKPFYAVTDYDYFREFYQKLFNFLDEQIVLKKKKS